MWQLQIELKSRLCAGSGFGSAGYADRDVVFDEYGLPYLPGRRLKGLLREALWETFALGVFSDLLDPDTVFGYAGAKRSADVDIGDARLKDADTLRAWLKLRPPQVTVPDVQDYYTEIIRQTKMDSATGSPEEDTLRATRVLRPRLKFTAEIRCSGNPNRFRVSLERAAQGLQFMGVGRTRGWGWVRCTLREVAATQVESEVPVSPAVTLDSDAASGECALPFHMTLQRNAICPVRTSDPNTVRSEDYLPGSALHGLFAGRFLSQHGTDQAFYDRFFSGRLKFLNAHPVCEKSRAVAIPHSIRELKHEAGKFVNVAAAPPEEPLRRVRGWVKPDELETGQAKRIDVKTTLHYHHTRSADLRLGRAVGDQFANYGLKNREDAGELFTYESIEMDQEFVGLIIGPRADLREIQSLVAHGETGVTIGRSRNAQYGGSAKWTWCDLRTLGTKDRVEHELGHAKPEGGRVAEVVVTLLSDLIGVNENGHPVPAFPSGELESALGVTFATEGSSSYVRTGWCGGYLAHQGLPRQQMQCLRSGSVFVFPLAGPIDYDSVKLVDAERRSYGIRVEEGFGRIAIAATVVAKPRLERMKNERYRGAPLNPQCAQYKLVFDLFIRRVNEHARAEGRKMGKSISDFDLAHLTCHLINRLMAIVDRPGLANSYQDLERLRDTVKKKLRKVWVSTDSGDEELLQELQKATDLSGAFGSALATSVFKQKNAGWIQLFGDTPPPFSNPQMTELARLTVKSILQTLLWRKRKAGSSGEVHNG